MTREFLTCKDGTWKDKEFYPCDAPAEVRHFGYMNGVDTDGREAVFENLRIECVAGHAYNELGAIVRYADEEEEA